MSEMAKGMWRVWAVAAVICALGCATGSGKGCDGGDSRSGFADVYSEEYFIKLEPVASSQVQDGRLILRGAPSPEDVERIKTFFDRAKEVEPDAEIYCLEPFFRLVHKEDIGKFSSGDANDVFWDKYFCGDVRIYIDSGSDSGVECIANGNVGFGADYNDYLYYFTNSSNPVTKDRYNAAYGDPRKVRPHLASGDFSVILEASTPITSESQVMAELYVVYKLNLAQYASRCVPTTAPCQNEGAPAQTPLCGPYAETPDMGSDMADMNADMDADMNADMARDAMDMGELDMGQGVDMADMADIGEDMADGEQDMAPLAEDMSVDLD